MENLPLFDGIREEWEARGEAKGIRMAQEAICKYLEVRFGDKSQDLQTKVKQYTGTEKLDSIINKIYTVRSLEEAGAVINAGKD